MKQRSTPLCILFFGLACAAKTSGDTDATAPATTGGPSETSSTSGSPDSSTTTPQGSTTRIDGSSDSSSSESSEGSSSTGTAGSCAEPPPTCASIEASVRVNVTATAASPYFVRHPSDAARPRDIVLFMPGGPGARAQAEPTFDLWLSEGEGIDDFLVVMPYGASGSLSDDHVIEVLDEVQACYCNTGRVHLGGTSNGGRLAYRLALSHADRFVTLLGAPGTFEDADPALLGKPLAGKRVFNAVGELDEAWQAGVTAAHEALLEAGVESSIFEMPGQGHIIDAAFDETVFFEFWAGS